MSNIPEFSVSEFSKSIKMVVEDAFGYVRIKGEISGFKEAYSGHLYFSLKDESEVLAAVCFKDFAELIDLELENGLEIIASGRVTTYGARSNYQIIVEKVEISGLGAIMEMLEKRRKKLEEEGLFDEIHKKQIPYFARKIGVITSATGSVIKDILHRVEDRCPSHILIYNAAVQGKNAAKNVIDGIKYFAKQKREARPDIIIIARGGGSVEDLLPFSDEKLVRQVFNCDIAVISAIGHETDFSLLDFVADLRAPTPTAAAEMATVVCEEIKEQISYLNKRLEFAKELFLKEKYERIKNLEKRIRAPKEILAQISDRFKNLTKIMDNSLNYVISGKMQRLEFLELSKYDIFIKINRKEERIDYFWREVMAKSQNLLETYQNKILGLSSLLEAKSYKEILNRGFAVVKGEKGQIISSAKFLSAKQKISLEMKDGEAFAYVLDKKNAEKSENYEKTAKNNNDSNQKELF